MTDLLSTNQLEVEVVGLHRELVAWFAGTTDPAELEFCILSRLAAELRYIMPGGVELTKEQLRDALARGHGSNPAFRIKIQNTKLVHRDATSALVTYQELQTNAVNSKQANNSRVTSALFVLQGEKRYWRHLHETWLPPGAVTTQEYDFAQEN